MKNDTNNKLTILGFPGWMFVIMAIVLFFLGKTDMLLGGMVGALGYAMVVGTLLGWIGNKIPVWKTWFGGGMLFSSLATAAFATYGLLGVKTLKNLNAFNGSMGFLNLYILILITGSVLSIDRKMLIRSFAGYIPTILGGVVLSMLFCGAVGAVTGIGFVESMMDFAIPIMGGGNGAGITPMSKMWAAAKGLGDEAASQWWAGAFATISLGNLCAVFMSALLNKLGQMKPNLTGNGQLMRSTGNDKAAVNLDEVEIGAGDYATGLALGLFCFAIATFYGKHISFINKAGLGFKIHEFAFMVILIAILNISDILPVQVRAGARGMQLFFVKYMSFPLMVTVGVGSKLTDYAKVFTNPANFLCIIATVLGAMLGTYIVGNFFNFYPVEGMLTAGLCMANGGGSGDVQCLGAANRMDMMSYAQISSRIGGAIMLVIASFFFGRFL